MISQTVQFLLRLREAGLEYVVIGGHAVYLHGYQRDTEDLDVLWLRTPESEKALLEALSSIHACWISNEIDPTTRLERIIPVSHSFIQSKHLMMLTTDIGFVDLFDYVPGHPDASPDEVVSERVVVEDIPFVSFPWLRRMKEAAGRSKDRLDIEELDKLRGDAP